MSSVTMMSGKCRQAIMMKNSFDTYIQIEYDESIDLLVKFKRVGSHFSYEYARARARRKPRKFSRRQIERRMFPACGKLFAVWKSHGSGTAFFLVKKRARFVTAIGERNDLNNRLSLRQNHSQRAATAA